MQSRRLVHASIFCTHTIIQINGYFAPAAGYIGIIKVITLHKTY